MFREKIFLSHLSIYSHNSKNIVQRNQHDNKYLSFKNKAATDI